jgi:hypothetical protein
MTTIYLAVWGCGSTWQRAGVLSAHDTREAAEAAVTAYLRRETNQAVGAWVEKEEDEATVEGCWRQVDGGVRYLVLTRFGEVTVDRGSDGALSGFARTGVRPEDEGRALRAAFREVRNRW